MTVANPYLYGIQWNERAQFWEICHGPGQPWVKAPHQYKRPKPSDQILGIMGKVGIGEPHGNTPKVSVTFPDLGRFKWGWKCPRCSYDNPERKTAGNIMVCGRCGLGWPK